MRIRSIVIAACVAALVCIIAVLPIRGSGSLSENAPSRTGRITTYDLTVTSGTDGKASVATTYGIGAPILQVLLMPGTGADEPTNLFDVTVTDRYDRDILVDEGLDLDTSVNKAVVPQINGELVVVDGLLTVDVNNAGSLNTVRLVLMYEEK